MDRKLLWSSWQARQCLRISNTREVGRARLSLRQRGSQHSSEEANTPARAHSSALPSREDAKQRHVLLLHCYYC